MPMFFVSLGVHPGTPSTLVVTSVPVLSQHMLFQKAVSQKYVGVACKVPRVTRFKIHLHPRKESPRASSKGLVCLYILEKVEIWLGVREPFKNVLADFAR